jgi:lysophospholipase L1-like esterase
VASTDSKPARRPGLLAKLGLAAGSLLFVFILAEGAARVLWELKMERLREGEAGGRRSVAEEWAHLPEIRGLFAVAKPNVRARMGGVLFETNGFGFRGPDRPIEKPEDTLRVAVIGDSITMGYGVRYEDTYAAHLEEALPGLRPGPHYEVINVGLSGLATAAVVDRFEELALQFDPDLVVYGYTLNDIEGEHYRTSYDASSNRDLKKVYASPLRLWRLVGPSWKNMVDLLFSPPGSYGYELDQNYFHNPEAWHEVEAGLDRLAALAAQRGICVVMLLHTRLESLNFLHPYHVYYDALAAASEQRGFEVVRPFARFDGTEATSLWVTAFDAHPSARGHELLAEALSEGLGTLPESCWQPRDQRAAEESR